VIICILGLKGTETRDRLVIVLEPANLERLRHGEPIFRKLVEFMTPAELACAELVIDYTPDAAWVTEQLAAGRDFRETMNAGMKRPTVFRRGNISENMVRAL
jgi:hypothetical protein